MQNISDSFSNTYTSRCYEGVEGLEMCSILWKSFHTFYFSFPANMGFILVKTYAGLDTFIVYNERRKVTSSAKKRRRHGDKSLQQVQVDKQFDTYNLH